MDTPVKHALPPALRRIRSLLLADVLLLLLLWTVLPLAVAVVAMSRITLWGWETQAAFASLYVIAVLYIWARRLSQGSHLFDRLRPLSDLQFTLAVEMAGQYPQIKRYLAEVAAMGRPLCVEDMRRIRRLQSSADDAAQAVATAAAQVAQMDVLRKLDSSSSTTAGH
ncbi:hypothetical protein [Rubrivivax rivuli]|uniref:Uncharacterized protein n=1 Tax=Rubrivivax rivuli TaxID=1862385 RepID=A0A437R7U8_9BURK|nr:hypothetical protein [Rubrivivax rivuli]RVU42858.1 hypothetical protein EOE66_21530 [Rubrivivax rivuli]